MEYIESRNSDWRGRIIRYAPLILWIGVIFFASSTSGSMSNTSTFIRPLLEFFFPNAPEQTLLVYHGYIRKFAHFAEYSMLGFWAARAFLASSFSVLQTNWALFSICVVAAVASLDEFNQSFNSARTGSFYDVMIDLTGGIFAVLLFWLFIVRRSNAVAR